MGIISAGTMFGEIALVSNCPRTATVRSLNYDTCATINENTFKDMCRMFPDVVTKFKERRSEYKDKWKKFLRKLIRNTDYFKDLPFMAQEELLYSLKMESYEEGQIMFDNGDTIQKLYYVSEGEISVFLQLDNGEEVITDMLSQGSSFGAYSILKDNKQLFTYKANSYVTVLSLDRESITRCREEFRELNEVLLKFERYIKEQNVPVCDYKTTQTNVKEKFRLAVNRSMILNEYENKKNSKIGLLIEQLKKQNAENELREQKREKRERYKKNIKVDIPSFDESTMYTIEVFKFMNKYIDKMTQNLNKNFEVIREGSQLLQILLNTDPGELDVIPEVPPEDLDEEIRQLGLDEASVSDVEEEK